MFYRRLEGELNQLMNWYLHWGHRVAEDHSLAVGELGISDGDVPERDVLEDEVLLHIALSPETLQLGPAETAGVGGTEGGAVGLLGRSQPDGKLGRRIHVNILVQNV